MPLLALLALLLGAPWIAAAQSACPTTAANLPDGPALRCSCAAGATGPIWGDGAYTIDSNICVAARHSGMIRPQGGVVAVELLVPAQGFPSRARHGVASQEFAGRSPAFQFVGEPVVAEPRRPGGVQECSRSMASDGSRGELHRCMCSARAVAGRGTSDDIVGGTDAYSNDSNTCRAALHAGVIGPQGGVVTVREQGFIQRLRGSTRNGVTSETVEEVRETFRFVVDRGVQACPATLIAYARAGDHLNCTCSAEAMARTGGVWGSGPYTSDSLICRAARHAGVLPPSGGQVRVVSTGAQPSWQGSARHGVQSANWPEYPAGFRFEAVR